MTTTEKLRFEYQTYQTRAGAQRYADQLEAALAPSSKTQSFYRAEQITRGTDKGLWTVYEYSFR